VENKGSGDITTVDVETFTEAFFGGLLVLELFSSTAEIPEYLEYQHLG